MKVENTDKSPVFNLLMPDGVRPQGETADITHVLLTNGNIYAIRPGSFHYYITSNNVSTKGIPYVSFDTIQMRGTVGAVLKTGEWYRVEIFPASVAGIAYRVLDGEHE